MAVFTTAGYSHTAILPNLFFSRFYGMWPLICYLRCRRSGRHIPGHMPSKLEVHQLTIWQEIVTHSRNTHSHKCTHAHTRVCMSLHTPHPNRVSPSMLFAYHEVPIFDRILQGMYSGLAQRLVLQSLGSREVNQIRIWFPLEINFVCESTRFHDQIGRWWSMHGGRLYLEQRLTITCVKARKIKITQDQADLWRHVLVFPSNSLAPICITLLCVVCTVCFHSTVPMDYT